MKTIQTTYRKRFDNSCYHHQCIANWTAVIMLQVLIGRSRVENNISKHMQPKLEAML